MVNYRGDYRTGISYSCKEGESGKKSAVTRYEKVHKKSGVCRKGISEPDLREG